MNFTQYNTQKTIAPGSPVLKKDSAPTSQIFTAAPVKNSADVLNYKGLLDKVRRQSNRQNIFNEYKTRMTAAPAPARDIGTELGAVMQQPRTTQNVARAKSLYDERAAKIASDPSLAVYANDDLQKRAQAYTASPGYIEDVDYAAQIKHLATLPATAENQSLMRELMAARESKILGADGKYQHYADDEVSRLGQSYLRQYVPEKADMGAYYDTADELAERMYADTQTSLKKQEDAELARIKETYDQARREADLVYAMKSRGMENVLAEQGIGRGLGAGPSSGYSETARAGALADYANNINRTYADEDASARELAAQYEAMRMNAMTARGNALMQNQHARADQGNADRNFELGVHQYNTGLDQFDSSFEDQRKQYVDALNRQKLMDEQSILESNTNMDLAKNADARAQEMHGYDVRDKEIGGRYLEDTYKAELDNIRAGTYSTITNANKVSPGGGGGNYYTDYRTWNPTLD